jgi:glycosyltransferase involved in cell wall biosynthesis
MTGLEHMSSDAPLVSVVMGVCNGLCYLPDQVRTLLEQTDARLEICALDDASDDGSYEWLMEAAKADARIHVTRNLTRIGVKANFLKGAAIAAGDFIAFCDQDDVWEHDKVSTLRSMLEKEPSLSLAYSDLEVCDEALRPLGSFWSREGILPRKGLIGIKSILRNLVPGCAMMIRRSLADQMRSVPASAGFMHDHLAFVLASVAGGVTFTERRLVKYRQHAANLVGSGKPAHAFDADVFHRETLVKIAALLEAFPELAGPANDLLLFMNRRAAGCSAPPAHWDYARFLKSDRWTDQALGVLEAALPQVYRPLKKLAGRA